MQKNSDYFYRRNKTVVERLLRGDKPPVIARDYGMTTPAVEAMFPECNYRLFCVSVKRRFGMGETSYEIAKFFGLDHSLILSVLNMSFQRESLLKAVLKMHDNGFSQYRISTVTKLSADDVQNVLAKTGRETKSMRYYKLIGNRFGISFDDKTWFEDICRDIVEQELPNYHMTLENKIEMKYRKKSKEMFQQVASEEFDENNYVEKDDHEFAEKLLSKLKRLKGLSRKDVITNAIVHYAKSVGIIKEGGGVGGKDITRLKQNLSTEVDEYYLSMAEIKQERLNDMQHRFQEKHKNRNR